MGRTRPAQGNLTLSLEPPQSSASGNCPQPGTTFEIGNPKAPSDSSPGDRLIDGERDTLIECSVRGSGPYTVSGTIQGVASGGDSVKFTLANGVIDANRQTGTAMVSVYTSKSGGILTGVDCTLAVVHDNVKSGSVWTTVFCPSVTSSTPGLACGVGSMTTVVFENCDGS